MAGLDPAIQHHVQFPQRLDGRVAHGHDGSPSDRIMVPPHIGSGTRVVIMTATGEYVERAKD